MADLEPRVNQLEEDVGILKGEIKSVLMEVRTNLLSQSNPFNGSSFGSVFASQAQPQAQAPAPAQPTHAEPAREISALKEDSRPNDRPQQQTENRNDFSALVPFPEQQQQPQHAPQQPVPLPVAPRRSWELNTLAMLLAWCQGNMVRLSDKEMTSLLSLARYGGLVDDELAGILLEISSSFDQGKEGRAATVSEYLLALHELHTVIKEEEEPSVGRLRRVS